MNPKWLISLAVLISIFLIACAETSEKSGTQQLSEQDLSFNPSEPWSGKWQVEGIHGVTGPWGLKQSGNEVVGDAVAKIRLLWISTQVTERQYGNGSPFTQR